MDIAVVGCGYVGLVTAVCLATLGHDVVGVEIDDSRTRLIQDGIPPFHEPGLAERLRSSLAECKFRVTSQITEASAADVIFLCVQTPSRADGSLDTRFLVDAAQAIGEILATSSGRHVVVVRSTVVPGTTEELIAPHVQDAHVAVAVNPEFLRQGSAVEDFLHADRIVIGCNEMWAADRVAGVYDDVDAQVIETSMATAELAKCASNALLGTLISFSNQMAWMAETIPGLDVEEVLRILHADRRFSPAVGDVVVVPEILSYLRSGIGFGGSCLPKDVRALAHFASSVGERAPLLEAVMEINQSQPERIVSMTREALGGLRDRPVSVLGLAFKANTDDLRESPGLKIVDLLLREGARVTAYDPLVPASALEEHERNGLTIAADLSSAVCDSDACLISTRAPEFRDVGRVLQENAKPSTVVIDGRRLLDPSAVDPHPFLAVGRGATGRQRGSSAFAGVTALLSGSLAELAEGIAVSPLMG